MTKEEIAYVETLNLLGSDLPGSELDAILAWERALAEASVARYVQCAGCPRTVPYEGPTDGEHFAELWEHMIEAHNYRAWFAQWPARRAWACPLTVLEAAV